MKLIAIVVAKQYWPHNCRLLSRLGALAS